jgi:hypothetical protein
MYGDAFHSIGMGDGRTGVKGVIRDREEAGEIARKRRAREAEELRQKMEKASLGGKTFLEEERERTKEEEREEGKGEASQRKDIFGRTQTGKFGHLREVGVGGFLSAVENEDRGVWVVVHLYHAVSHVHFSQLDRCLRSPKSLDRCYILDDTLSRLARVYPDTKFLHARASSLGFASKSVLKRQPTLTSSRVTASRPDDDDPWGDEEGNTVASDDTEEIEVDTDMLPTMLVYRDGELVHNWVRVDWEAGKAGIEELLLKCVSPRDLSRLAFSGEGSDSRVHRHHIIPQGFAKDDRGISYDDDDDDLVWSDEEEGK